MTVDALARRFGLRWSEEGNATTLRRGARAVRISGRCRLDDAEGRHRALCVMLGARFGLDRLAADPAERSVGAVQRVLPRAAVELAAAIAERPFEGRPLTSGSRLIVAAVRETGVLQLLTEPSDDAARELFFNAYKARPVVEGLAPPPAEAAADARVTRWREPGGIASSLASLLPDFDLDTAREGGFVFVASWSELVIVRCAPHLTPQLGSQLRALGRQLVEEAALPMSRRVYRLTLDGLAAGEVVGVVGELDGAELVQHLLDVSYDR